MSQVTAQNRTGRGSNQRLTLMEKHLAGSSVRRTGMGIGGFAMGRGQQVAEEKKCLFKRSFWHPILSAQQLRTQGKSFQQINTTTKTRICTLNTTSIEMSTHCYEFHGRLIKNEGPVFWKSTNTVFMENLGAFCQYKTSISHRC